MAVERMKLRLDKYLADMGIGTRSEIKEKIKKADVFLKNLIFKKTSAILWLQIYLAAR